MGIRREARELALQMLYALDANPAMGLRETLQTFREERDETPARTREFAEGLVTGVQQHRETIDTAIKARSKNWALSRMPRVDLNVMRLAVFELMFRSDIPKKVTINEAIEIARRFGDKDSPAFVNGILDEIEACAKTEGPAEEHI
ncbi:transcription antitermination factor NusB [Oryzomonas sagensis]|uniref:Transcription antitermination protein NusB n=1 Tax=Oryzomonas sagensis TaxID=2603857 RepID=A0ABQ6TPE3_9BACT|nr:transcription antitermination factor NusB [Oryzomonas sagensis]KAB0670499.1 transcription antitermination factor NusB [Oryzomonas sagensis]